MIESILPEKPLCPRALIEAILFVAPGSVYPEQLASALNIPIEDVESGLNELENYYLDGVTEHGLRIQRHHGRVQLTSAPQAAQDIERFLGMDVSSRLSKAALETLAIIMYRQPVTRPQIDSIRGVNSDGVLKSLLLRGLIQEVGRAEAPGRPILYSITTEFLQYFGLNSLADLPPLEVSNEAETGADETNGAQKSKMPESVTG